MDLPGGSFRMGSTSFYPEEAPIHTATVGAFAIERHPVTNAQFAEFVDATGYVTVAERPLDPALYPGVAEADLLPGALVFTGTPGPVEPQRLAAVVGLGARRATGARPSVPAAISPVRTTTPSSRWPTPMPGRMRRGRAGGCRPRRSSSTPPAPASPPPMPGARSHGWTAS